MAFFNKNTVFVIAEAGKNFITLDPFFHSENYLDNAKGLAAAAKLLGCNAIKFQTHVFEDESKFRSKERWNWIKKNEELTPYTKFWVPLKKYCDEIGIMFMTTPMSRMAANKINDLVYLYKIGSGNVTDFDLLDCIAKTRKPVILSTGMSTEKQIDEAVKILSLNELALLHCVSIYPCPVEKLNLATIEYLQKKYQKVTGFSDHSKNVETPKLAIQLGARIIEKHFTLDNNAWGPDHRMSMSIQDFKEMMKIIETTKLYMFSYGKSEKVVTDEEQALWSKFRV